MGATTLYRPVGQTEFELIAAAGYRKFPPRLPEQPYFYPVTNQEYAAQIARDWDTKDAASNFVGHVLRFSIDSDFLSKYPLRTVGGSMHQEYWIPASDLDDFNAHIVGQIETLRASSFNRNTKSIPIRESKKGFHDTGSMVF